MHLIPHPGGAALNRLNPRPFLLNPSTIDSMSQVLKEYNEKDKVLRVRKGIEKILDNWEYILEINE